MIFDLLGKPLIAALMSLASLFTAKALGQRKNLVAVKRHRLEP